MIQKSLNVRPVISQWLQAFFYKIFSSLGQNLTARPCSLWLLKFLGKVFLVELFHVLDHLLLGFVLLLAVVGMQWR
jgi:hypothetical protein